MDRDLVLFLDHTNQHVINQIKLSHPEWVAENGACKPCSAYYETQISGAGFNIGPAERRKRWILGFFSLAVSFSGAIYLKTSQMPHMLQLGLFAPFFLGFFGVIQAREKTCSLLAEMESKNMDWGPEKIADSLSAQELKKKGREILLKSAAAAAILTAVCFFIP